MKVSSSDPHSLSVESNHFVRFCKSFLSIKEAVFWLGRKLNPYVIKNKVAEAIRVVCKPGLLPILPLWASPDSARSAIHDERQTLTRWLRSEARSIAQSGNLREKIGGNPGFQKIFLSHECFLAKEEVSQKTPPLSPETRMPEQTQETKKPPIPRRYPPLSPYDTMICVDDKMTSEHGFCDVFADNEILAFCPLTEEKKIHGVSVAHVVGSKKHVIQQQATRGCTAAAVTMLLLDHGKEPNRKYLVSTNLGNTTSMTRGIREAGLEAFVHEISPTLSGLRQAIISRGSAIVTLDIEECGGHVVVVDEITESLDQVTLRDPYHGWAITVSGEVFLKQNPGRTIVQV